MTNAISGAFNSASLPHQSREEGNLTPTFWVHRRAILKPLSLGTIRMPPLLNFTMKSPCVTAIPRVISSEPDLLQEDFAGPITQTHRKRNVAQNSGDIESVEICSLRLRNLASKPIDAFLNPRPTALSEDGNDTVDNQILSNGSTNKIISDSLISGQTPISSSIQIPLHDQYGDFISRHEVPRKLLHVSIGLFSVYFYMAGIQTTTITPWLIRALIPITATDILRLNFESLNKIYIQILGKLMRKSEYRCFNGVIWYLIGAWFVLTAFPKDIGLMGILLLSWCDTAASTMGRAFGKYTPSIRKGKSLAGSAAAFFIGVTSAAAFWGWLAPRSGPFPGDENFPFMFTGTLHLPATIRNKLGLTVTQASVKGFSALGIMSIWTGFVASASEATSFFGLDDNLTIPVLSGIGMWGFLKMFG
ncbi:CTP-dependent diacylglycerol kinase 1 [Golovinomyces cichoracearum]|uniref:CTP-dependent diacylglycerol kinase 1 n=1 Tax=Golovinomyces cichoracearum TaxID=62708 RepID=A0A420HVQ4_9PEZI|nr:CTP-dependent diacylglycerol kinase 1 [Golovinomyces cichoracearum]